MTHTFLMYLTFFLNNTDQLERQKIQCKVTVNDSYSYITADMLKKSGGIFTGDFECMMIETGNKSTFEYIEGSSEESSENESECSD